MADIKGKTAGGFEFCYPAERADDAELFEMLVAMDEGDMRLFPKAAERLLGKEQKAALYDFYRVDGRVPLTRVYEAFGEIMDNSSETKNSEPSPAMSEDAKTN